MNTLTYQKQDKNERRAADNSGLVKAGLTEVIEHLFFYQPLAIFELTVFKALPSPSRKTLWTIAFVI
jgi:hypothetical protein